MTGMRSMTPTRCVGELFRRSQNRQLMRGGRACDAQPRHHGGGTQGGMSFPAWPWRAKCSRAAGP